MSLGCWASVAVDASCDGTKVASRRRSWRLQNAIQVAAVVDEDLRDIVQQECCIWAVSFSVKMPDGLMGARSGLQPSCGQTEYMYAMYDLPCFRGRPQPYRTYDISRSERRRGKKWLNGTEGFLRPSYLRRQAKSSMVTPCPFASTHTYPFGRHPAPSKHE